MEQKINKIVAGEQPPITNIKSQSNSIAGLPMMEIEVTDTILNHVQRHTHILAQSYTLDECAGGIRFLLDQLDRLQKSVPKENGAEHEN